MNDASIARAFAEIYPGDSLLTEIPERWTYGYDNSRMQALPDLVAFPSSRDQVVATVIRCRETGIPITARGRGTNTAGGAVPTSSGLVLSFERMNKMLELDPDNRYMRVQPGITNGEVQQLAAAHGFFWPPDPTSADYCTIGGNIAMDAAGPRAVKYGSTHHHLLGLEAVTGKGDVIVTGGFTTKNVVGYDLTRLLTGSEGTLALVTEAILKLTPLPGARASARLLYEDITQATAAITRVMAQPVIPSVLEFMDGAAIDLVREYGHDDIPADTGALLMIEVEGEQDHIAGLLDKIREAAQIPGLVAFDQSRSDKEKKALWAMRKSLSPALRKVAPNKLNEDVVVPISRIPELINGLALLSSKYGIPIINFGHAGNGNIHVNLLYDTQDESQNANAKPCLDEVFELVLRLQGTISGEHGIGAAKRDYVGSALGKTTLDLMWQLKRQFDPDLILNPGKLFPSEYTDEIPR